MKFLSILIFPLKILLHLYLSTLRIKTSGKKELEELLDSSEPVIIALWHNKLFMVPILRTLATKRLFRIAISNSKDGDLATQLAESYDRFKVIRVRHNARFEALNTMTESTRAGSCLVITPDGPRGPRHEVKAGALFIAQRTKASVVPFTWNAQRAWRLKSWDRFEIPLPFTTVDVRFGPILPPQTSADELQKIL